VLITPLLRSQKSADGGATRGLRFAAHFKMPLTINVYPERGWDGVHRMELLSWIVDGTSVFGLAVYGAGMALFTSALAWANHLDRGGI
jgi:hypothetical protein